MQRFQRKDQLCFRADQVVSVPRPRIGVGILNQCRETFSARAGNGIGPIRDRVEPELFRQSYRDMMRVLRANPLIKVPPDLLFVGRVMGLLNGLSMTLRSRTNLLVQMARLMDEDDEAKAEGAVAVMNGAPRRLLEVAE